MIVKHTYHVSPLIGYMMSK